MCVCVCVCVYKYLDFVERGPDPVEGVAEDVRERDADAGDGAGLQEGELTEVDQHAPCLVPEAGAGVVAVDDDLLEPVAAVVGGGVQVVLHACVCVCVCVCVCMFW